MPERPALKASQNSAALFPKPEITPTPVITTLFTLCFLNRISGMKVVGVFFFRLVSCV
jgi:hypothetical protein